MPETAPLPNVAEILGALLQRAPAPRRPLLVAIAERMAAERYRVWADAGPVEHRAALRACADREDEIATRVEALHADAAAVKEALLAANPDLAELTRAIFGGRPLAEQLAIQAQGERAGAALWRRLAEGAARADERETYLACARLEEESAAYLESLAR
jgi:hypothetical protein